MVTTTDSYYRGVSKTNQRKEKEMKVYSSKAIVLDYTADDMVLSFEDIIMHKQISVIIPRYLLDGARQTSANCPVHILVDDELSLVGFDSCYPVCEDEELLDE